MDVKKLEYPAKVLLAWAEAISGNPKIRDWLMANGYRELGVFTFALRNKEDARKWLMENGFPHLMALINGVEGNKQALEWLRRFNFTVLEYMALAGDGEEDAYEWLRKNGHSELFIVAKRIQIVKDDIEADNNDPHKINFG
ncbi:MAG: hypothetical protein ACK40M_01700 [Flavobacteriales bacterium]